MSRSHSRFQTHFLHFWAIGSLLALWVSPVHGQAHELFGIGETGSWMGQSAVIRSPSPGRAALFSAILPGSGQWTQGKNRWAAYAATELWAWVVFFDRRGEGKAIQRRYRDLAWDVARRVSSGPRTEGSWEYYEALTKYRSSGAYDSDPTLEGIQPEENPETFNGSVWGLAQDIFFPESQEGPIDPIHHRTNMPLTTMSAGHMDQFLLGIGVHQTSIRRNTQS